MKIQFSQKQFANTPFAEQMKDLIQFCVPQSPRYRQGLLVKVMVYTSHPTDWNGSYRCEEKHGLYDNEIFSKDHKHLRGITSVITLKVGQQVPKETLLYLIAHETGHHITWVKDQRFGEKKADKIAQKIIDRYNSK